MQYKPLNEILDDLDAQQRREVSALTGRVAEAELKRRRAARQQLATVAVFFIEKSWERIGPSLQEFSLEAEAGSTRQEVLSHLESLSSRAPSYGWGWVRARMSSRLMREVEVCMPELLAIHPDLAAEYRDALRRLDAYWFRETPLHHLKAGYHTALAVACKWYGSAFELMNKKLNETPDGAPNETPEEPLVIELRLREGLRRFASFSMTMLYRTDGYLWDSAGAMPLDAIANGSTLFIGHRELEELDLTCAPDFGLRLGCPALRARAEHGLPAFSGIVQWVEQVFTEYLLLEPHS